jgi:hypothetical protein
MALNSSSAPTTINDIEETIRTGLEALRRAPMNDAIMSALGFLIPEGFAPVVQLEEEGRKKRSNSAASNWDPERGEIVIYFERTSAPPPARAQQAPQPVAQSFGLPRATLQAPAEPAEATAEELRQCCEALAHAESGGKPFVSLKWFRDTALPSYSYPWTISPVSRQRVLTKAIESGAVSLDRVPNPKSPQFPTTTVKLNRPSETADIALSEPVLAGNGADL